MRAIHRTWEWTTTYRNYKRNRHLCYDTRLFVRRAHAVTNCKKRSDTRLLFCDKSGSKSAIFATRCVAIPRPVNPITIKVVFTDGSSGIYLPNISV